MGILISRDLNGWNPWYFLKTVRKGIPVPHAYFPFKYLPASSFISQSFSDHCDWPIPWHTVGNTPFNNFMIGGGISGTLVGSASGLNLVANNLLEPTNITYGIGQFPPPLLGYCIGDLYKEFTYYWLDVLRSPGVSADIINYTFFSDVFQRSRLRRMYLHHGSVVRYVTEVIGGVTKHFLTLDVGDSLPEGFDKSGNDFPPFKLTIHLKIPEDPPSDFEETFTVNVLEVMENFQLVIEEPPWNISSGDFYILDKIFSLRDPYLLTGYWLGTENENPLRSVTNSGNNLHQTSDNCFYDKVSFTGYYILKDIDKEEIIPVEAGASFFDSGNKKWHWIKSSLYKESEVYGNEEKRWGEVSEIVEETIEEENVSYAGSRLDERETGELSDVYAWINLEEINYIRVEISKGGDSLRNNWHSPILTRSWLKQGDYYFKIIAQPDGNVIDVALRDVTDSVNLTIDSGGTIFNQYGWFISEHFMGESRDGIFGGYTYRSEDAPINILYLTTPGESQGTHASAVRNYNPLELNGLNSFYNRFRLDTALPGGTTKIWTKYDGWRVTNNSGTTLDINSITFSDHPTHKYTQYDITMDVAGDASLLDGQKVWVTFDVPYERLLDGVAPLYQSKFEQGVEEANATLCGDLGYVSIPIKISISQNTIVGICSGLWWGMNIQARVSDNDYLPLIVTTPSTARGVSAFYHKINQQDWLLYKDAYTGRVTIRKGQLSFREHPQKIEVSVGKSQEVETGQSFPLTLNKDYDRIKAIRMTMPVTENGAACTFQLGSPEDYYGFLISGAGLVDFQSLRRSGNNPGDVTTDQLKFRDFYCSPCYLYHKNKISFTERKTLYIGADTKDGPVYVKNGDPTDLEVHYIHDSQTIPDSGYMDIHQMSDGEVFIVYSRNVDAFEFENDKDENKNNSSENDTTWDYPHGVFIAASPGDGLFWGCPLIKNFEVKKDEDIDDKFQWPLMVLNNVDYQYSLYDSLNHSLFIVSKHFTKSQKAYLAAVRIPVLTLLYQTELCNPITGNDDPYKFLWRPPVLETMDSNDKKIDSWTITDNYPSIVNNGPSLLEDGEVRYHDDLFKIMGGSDTESDIVDENIVNWGIIGGDISKEGIYRLYYDDQEGVRMLYSDISGSFWKKSEIVLAKGGQAGMVIGNYLFYISPFGIECKYLSRGYFNNAYSVVEGVNEDFIEEVQLRFDNAPTKIIGSGQIESQRLAGYEDSQGVVYVFYYDNEGLLTALTSSDFLTWKVASNF
jgi:hypothetical protein